MWDMNYHFVKNLFEWTNYIVAFTTYREYAWLGIAVILVIAYLVYLINKKIKVRNNKIRFGIIAICCVFLVTPYSLIHRFLVVVLNMTYNPSYKLSHREIFKELTDKDFIDKNALIVEKPAKYKNLVLIFMESFEQNFLDEKYFPDLAVNMKKLAKNGEFYSRIRQIEGSSWTRPACIPSYVALRKFIASGEINCLKL
jgi:hypothetical protein